MHILSPYSIFPRIQSRQHSWIALFHTTFRVIALINKRLQNDPKSFHKFAVFTVDGEVVYLTREGRQPLAPTWKTKGHNNKVYINCYFDNIYSNRPKIKKWYNNIPKRQQSSTRSNCEIISHQNKYTILNTTNNNNINILWKKMII